MAKNELGTGSFPTMGTSASELHCVAKPERGRSRTRGTGGKGGSDIAGTGTKSNRGASYGKMGATLHPTATLYAQNAAEATQGQRHVIMMPSRSSWTDQFRAPAKYGRTLS
jgi:hypothetical protein